MPVKNEALTIIYKGSDRAPQLRILRIETGILEGPTAGEKKIL